MWHLYCDEFANFIVRPHMHSTMYFASGTYRRV
jgi:hypothetical protein